MSRWLWVGLAGMLWLCGAQAHAQVQDWPGRDDPALLAARDLWLGGADDMAVLQALAPLAEGGNTVAQVFLATLAADAALRPAGVDALARADRIALTRAPGGLSGTSWLRVAAEAGDARAAALQAASDGFALSDPAQRRAAMTALQAAGEARAALRMMVSLANFGGLGPDGAWTLLAETGGHPAPGVEALLALEITQRVLTDPAAGALDPVTALRVMAAINATGATEDDLTLIRGAQRQHLLAEDPAALAAAHKAALASGLAEPLRGFCAPDCPGDRLGACTLALVTVTGGVPGFLTLSPLEGLVTTPDYRASPRFRGDLRAGLQVHPRAYLQALDGCAAAAVWD